MSSRRPTTTTGELWRGYRRPLRRDRALWLALGLWLVAVVIEFALSSPTTPLGWLAFGLIAAAMVVLIVSLTGVFVGVFRGFADGWRWNKARAATAPASPASASATSNAATSNAATSNAATSSAAPRSRATPDEPTPTSDPTTATMSIPAVPESVKNLAAAAQAKAPKQADVDRTARALGRAASAARRAYRKGD